jgi:hypothetical protein
MMEQEPRDAQWQQEIREVLSRMREWRAAHPHATFVEIEAAVDERLDGLRARTVEEAAQASRAARLWELPAAERPRCPACGQVLVDRSRSRRTRTVRGNRQVHLERSYGVCPACGVWRALTCSDRWSSGWPQIRTQLRAARSGARGGGFVADHQQRHARRSHRCGIQHRVGRPPHLERALRRRTMLSELRLSTAS